MFQFALPRGERHIVFQDFAKKSRFNSRSRVGSDYQLRQVAWQIAGFNSRSRVGSDLFLHRTGDDRIVSIRAPAWGATRIRRSCGCAPKFQFALPRGERPSFFSVVSICDAFQFALPRGERRAGGSAVPADHYVSIRAPAWGATHLSNRRINSHNVSIRAPARGATLALRSCCWERPGGIAIQAGARGFNSRSRVGSDARIPRRSRCYPSFNSRSRVGSDPRGRPCAARQSVSIRAPAWGATQPVIFALAQRLSFNSRSRVGSDRPRGCGQCAARVSIRAPAWGATGVKQMPVVAPHVSIRAPAWGAT